jgi:broad specificity phosphatase PhoE
VQDLARRHAGASVVVVSHVGPIKALLCAVMDVPLTAARRMFLASPSRMGGCGVDGALIRYRWRQTLDMKP